MRVALDRGVAERRGVQLVLDLAGQRVAGLLQASSAALTRLYFASTGVVDSAALVEAIRVCAPNWPTLELSCL